MLTQVNQGQTCLFPAITSEKNSLFPYQDAGALWLSKRRLGLLADEMGLGKSAQAIRACDFLVATPILVVCPAVARVNWLREFEKFSSIKRDYSLILGSNDELKDQKSAIVSYDFVAKYPEKLKKWKWEVLILDECHYLKQPESLRTKSILGKYGIIHNSTRVFALSGTPMPNHAAELWPILFTFGATKLKYDDFVNRYCTYYTHAHRKQITGTKHAFIPELKTLLKPIMLRRKKEEVMRDLPPIHYQTVSVEPQDFDLETTTSFTQYIYPMDRKNELEEKIKKEREVLESLTVRQGWTEEGLRRMEALANSIVTLRRYTGLRKVASVIKLVTEEMENKAYEKLVIFAIHRDVIESLREGLSKFNPVTLYGGTPPETRTKRVDKFQNTNRANIFIANIQAAGTAITLTASHQVLFIEQDWVPGNNAQAAMRCHRIGQERPVFVRFISLNDSLDQRITEVLKNKTKRITEVFEK